MARFGQLPVEAVVASTPPEWAFDPQKVDVLYQPVYDRVNYAAAGATSLNFFSVALGGSATLIRAGAAATVTKTRRDTNMVASGSIPNEGFDWQGVGMVYVPLQQVPGVAATNDIADDIQRIMYGGYFTFKVLDNTLLELPILTIPSIISLGGLATGNDVMAVQPGKGDQKDAFWVTKKKFLPPNSSFTFTMNFDGTVSLSQTFDIYVFLLGEKYRPK